MFKKILIANRGEIALRVIRAARELGVRTVAVYSDADRHHPHVLAADEAVRLGPAPSSESYLRGDRIVEAAIATGADAIHPGYGFLAERAPFIQLVEDAGLTFIGPSAAAVEAMGDKTAARRRMIEAGVPVVPGTDRALSSADEAARIAREIGFPILLKAAAGGGGKGMRAVHHEDDLEGAFRTASNEARSAFGDDSLYIEKFLDGPRHIEIQILADGSGHTIHLGERECSIQRRHQKLIEEAPSPILTAEERSDMGRTAVAAARAVGYEGAGTVEFLYQDGRFYFLEMNTRIQVEHPVTEMITGIDLVQEQIRIAAGESLRVTQEEVEFRGHSIECRITSEDPRNGFLPSTGVIEWLRIPTGQGVRWDSGIEVGTEIALHYDPLLAKLIVWAPNRELAITRMMRALEELRVVGVETSTPFHLNVMAEAEFRAGQIDIRYLERHGPTVSGSHLSESQMRLAAVTAAMLERSRRERPTAVRVRSSTDSGSAWRGRGGWRRR